MIAKYQTLFSLRAAACLLPIVTCSALAQSFPTRPVRLIVPFSAGGGSDITARAIGHKLSERWGQQVIVENRLGAAGNIGAEVVARAAPDGYTLLVITATQSVNAALHTRMTYDLTTDLTPLSQVTSLPYVVMVHPSLPVKSIKEFVALAKQRTEGLTYGSSGIGSLGHLSGALLTSLTGAHLLYIPYKGGAASVADVIGGQINFTFSAILHAQHARSGKLRALAVTTLKRSAVMPQIPTMIEAGIPGYDINQWNGILGPKGLPAPLAARISNDINDTLRLPDVKERLASDGSEAVGTTGPAFAEMLRTEIAKWQKVGRQAGIKIE